MTFLIYDDGKAATIDGVDGCGKVVGTVDKTTGDGLGIDGGSGTGEKLANDGVAGAEVYAVGTGATELVGTLDGTDDDYTTTKVVPGMVTTETPDGTSDDLTITGDGGNEVAGGRLTYVTETGGETGTGDGDGATTGVGDGATTGAGEGAATGVGEGATTGAGLGDFGATTGAGLGGGGVIYPCPAEAEVETPLEFETTTFYPVTVEAVVTVDDVV
jgi:hypothetical protein